MEVTLTIMMLFFCIGAHLKTLVSASTGTWSCIDDNGNSLKGDPVCESTKVIAIKEVEAQIIRNVSSCRKHNLITSTAGDDKCCLLNNINACIDRTLLPTIIQHVCSGRSDCMMFQNDSDLFGCNLTSHGFISLILDYSCIRRSNIKEMCKPWRIASPSDQIYLVNNNYLPITGRTNESFGRVPVSNNICSCSIEVDTCNVNLTIFSVHVDFVSELGLCKQSMEFSDSEGKRQYSLGCGNKAMEILYTTTSNYIKIQFHNSLSQDGGAFWIGVQGAAIDPIATILSCPASTPKYCRVSGNTASKMPQSSTYLLTGTTSSNLLQSSTDLVSGTISPKNSSKMPESNTIRLPDEYGKNVSGPEGVSSGAVIGISIAAAFVLLIAVVALIAKLIFSRNKSNTKTEDKLECQSPETLFTNPSSDLPQMQID